MNRSTFLDGWSAAKRHYVHRRNTSWASKATDEWGTDPKIFARLDREFHFTLDVCASDINHKCARYYTKKDNGRTKKWTNEICWMNPPYSEVGKWLYTAYTNCLLRNATVVCLVLARVGNVWFHEYAAKGEIRFIRGRLTFYDSNGERSAFACPAPSMIVIFRPEELRKVELREAWNGSKYNWYTTMNKI